MKKSETIKNIHFFIIGIFVLVAIIALTNVVNAETKAFEKFTRMYIKTDTAAPGEKVYVDLYIIGDKSDVKININTDSFSADIKDINTNSPYFILPTDVSIGKKYEMFYINVTDKKGTITYSTTEGLSNYTNCFNKKYVTAKSFDNTNQKDVIAKGIELVNFSITGDTSNVKLGDKIPVNIKTIGNIERISANFRNKETNQNIFVNIKDYNTNNSYIEVTNNLEKIYEGSYELKNISLYSSESEDYVRYTKDGSGNYIMESIRCSVKTLTFNGSLTFKDITITPTNKSILTTISLKSTTAKKNEQVNVNLSTTIKCKKVMLSFSNKVNDKNMTVYLKGLENKPYFNIPYTVDEDEYSLTYMIITDENDKTYHFSIDATGYEGSITQFNFNSNIKVEADEVEIGNDNILYLDNDKITSDIIAKLTNINSNIVITIDANKDSIIKSDIFNAIKGSNKTILIKYDDNEWIFNGTNITNIKNIDVSCILNKIDSSSDDFLMSTMNKGLVLNFPSNGELPGKVLIRIKATESILKYLGESPAYVYYYDENGKKLDKVAIQITLTEDGYYEFYINHNSTYILTTEKPSDEYISDDNSILELNGGTNSLDTNITAKDSLLNYFNNNSIIIVVMGATIVILIIIIIAFIISRKKIKKN